MEIVIMKKSEDMQYSEDTADRRSFLKGATITTAAVGSGALAANVLAAETDPEKARPANLGYQETVHVKEYYRLARF
jgi:hypothetical protein